MKESLCQILKIAELDIAGRERLGSLDIDFSLFSNCCILPGLTDVHVHLREPGFLYKETMKTGTMAAAAGGFTDIFAMPNLKPCPDSIKNLQVQLDAIKKDAIVNVYPYGAITVNEAGENMAALEDIAPYVIAFTDDGRGVADDKMMLTAMECAKKLDKIIVAHCEDESYPKESSASEYKQLERDIRLVRATGCKYHMCHVSTKESLQLIRAAKAEGLDITCETAPHYLTIANDEIEDAGRFKMNPPIKSTADKEALIEALKDGTIDMIATDHAPHSAAEKSLDFKDSAFGIVGLETALPVLYTKLAETHEISLPKLLDLLYINPRKRFGLECCSIEESLMRDDGSFAVWDMQSEYALDSSEFFSLGKSTPFEGWRVKGRCMATVVSGKVAWRRQSKPGSAV